MKKILSVAAYSVLIFALTLGICSCGLMGGESSKDVSVAEITLNKTVIALVEGEEETLTAEVKPANATDKTLKWSSSNAQVATVDGGRVTAVSAGTAKITAVSADGKIKAECDVTVVAAVPVKLTAAEWTKAIDDTLGAKNFTAVMVMDMEGEATIEVVCKADAESGKMWTKNTAVSVGDDGKEEKQTAESYMIRGENASSVYDKAEGGEWELQADDQNFDEIFNDWLMFGDGLKAMFEMIKENYDGVLFDQGVYTLTSEATDEMPALNAKIEFCDGYICNASIASGEESQVRFEFSDFNATVLPEAPSLRI